ncbi:hypothetical protein [Stackebrandtia nassauensis]|uniref:Uncharacterized protein n=1 Tax=Stackebrandtia nassauensis (strain DSM 44728 / CIP 108903 / NRRL B-16338 / NBRC 102104 / LLR-40K-21) TaxID=446470 RepID=D3Q8H4_STANL|nr:hypothetical protein [Stackebrandtia nassauensis]ADD42548.1 hypothetical protein Snas_2873 [Stackebrandtia nassauensis DSM 44728]
MLDETQAYPRAEQHLRDAVTALDADIRLEPELRNAVSPPPESGQSHLVNVEVSYVAKLPESDDVFARNRGLFERLKKWWLGQGYELVTDNPSEPFTVLRVADPHDGFVIALRQGKIGNLWFTVNSPLVTPTGVEPPPPGLT